MMSLEPLQDLALHELLALGLSDFGYIRPVRSEGFTRYLLHTADGNEFGCVTGPHIAAAIFRARGLQPLSLH